MSDEITLTMVIGAIGLGQFDDDLRVIRNAVKARGDQVGAERFRKLRVGDEVTFAPEVGKGLGGTKAVVVQKNRTRVRVRSTKDGNIWNANPSILELA